MFTKICIVCGKKYTKGEVCRESIKRWAGRKYCSHVCQRIDLRNQQIGTKKSEETKQKIRDARAKQVISPDATQRAVETRKNNGYEHSLETREKIRQANLGNKSHFWKGGRARLCKVIRQSFLYRQWRKKVYERDDYTCVNCFSRGVKLQCDHIYPFHMILNRNNIQNWQDAETCKELWDISNGRALCVPCHRQTDTYAKNLRS